MDRRMDRRTDGRTDGWTDGRPGDLGVGEDGGDPVAAGALDVHEVGVGVLHQPLQLVPPLLVLGQRQQEVLRQLGDRGEGEGEGRGRSWLPAC